MLNVNYLLELKNSVSTVGIEPETLAVMRYQ